MTERMSEEEFAAFDFGLDAMDGYQRLFNEARRARAEVAAKTEECALHESAARKNLATIVAAEERVRELEKALREIAIRTGQWEARAIDCQEIAAAALKEKP